MRDNGPVTRTAADTRPQLVIFDLDGTLTDSAHGIVASFRHALAAVGAVPPTDDLRGWRNSSSARPCTTPWPQLGLGERADEAIAAYRADYTAAAGP